MAGTSIAVEFRRLPRSGFWRRPSPIRPLRPTTDPTRRPNPDERAKFGSFWRHSVSVVHTLHGRRCGRWVVFRVRFSLLVFGSARRQRRTPQQRRQRLPAPLSPAAAARDRYAARRAISRCGREHHPPRQRHRHAGAYVSVAKRRRLSCWRDQFDPRAGSGLNSLCRQLRRGRDRRGRQHRLFHGDAERHRAAGRWRLLWHARRQQRDLRALSPRQRHGHITRLPTLTSLRPGQP